MSTRQPFFEVSVNGVPLKDVGIDYYVESVAVEESDSDADRVIVRVLNQEQRFSQEFLFLERSDLEAAVGYDDALGVRIKTRLDSPRFVYPEGGGTPVIELVGHGGAMDLAEPERRRAWLGLRYEEIASKIAQENGLKSDLDQTVIQYEQVSQIGESDIVFLRRLASRVGFMVYVDGGVLHFHKERVTRSSAVIQYADGAKNVLGGKFSARLVFGGEKITATGYDKLAKKTLSVSYDDTPDALTEEQVAAGGVRQASELVGERSERFVRDVSQLVNETELEELVKGAGQAAQWVVGGELTIYGAPLVRARRVVALSGFLALDGDYWVSWARHTVSRKRGYQTELRLRRTVLGSRQRGKPTSSLSTSSFGTRAFNRRIEDMQGKSEQRGSVVLE